MKIFKIALCFIILIGVLGLIKLFLWLSALDKDIQKRLANKRFAPPAQFFAQPMKLFVGQNIWLSDILKELHLQNYQQQDQKIQDLLSGHYQVLTPSQCFEELSFQWIEGLASCLIFRKTHPESPIYTIVYGDTPLENKPQKTNHRILHIEKDGVTLSKEDFIELDPQIFAQYYGNQPILRQVIDLEDVPQNCIQAVLAIEDADFFDHLGISFTGILRAFLKNIRSGQILQGGSTITQQLVKNDFLTHKRSFQRKIKEIAMALLLEYRANKHDILETYLNILYMGQLGSFEIRGYQKASQYYFGKHVENLQLHECSLLASLISSPGRYNPFTHPNRALKRRTSVLDRLLEQQQITEQQVQEAKKQPLPKHPSLEPNRSVSFFIEAARQTLKNLNIDTNTNEGLNIFTTLRMKAQMVAQDSLQKTLKEIEAKTKKTNQRLEAALVSADPKTGFVQAMVGGRDFRQSQFNRAVQSQRQIGSIVKPIVYLTSLNQKTASPFTPLTLLEDKPFTIKYPGGQWSPKNYQNRYFRSIPMYYALARSLNSATAHLGIQVGLNNIAKMMRLLGGISELKPLPSLTLGTWELSPLEILQVYSSLANLGAYIKLTLIAKIENLEGDILYQHVPYPTQIVDRRSVAQLIGMMKQVMRSGTARGVIGKGLLFPVAGKTGTTNGLRDSWFAGFSPFHVAVVWVGYDNNKSSGLTGASGALPIWADYMLNYAFEYPNEDFPYVEGTKDYLVDLMTQEALGVPQEHLAPLLELTFLESTDIEALLAEYE